MASVKIEKSETPREVSKIIGNTTGYIYDIVVNLSYDCIQNSEHFNDLNRASIAIIVANIIHKYKKWSAAGQIIMRDLINKIDPPKECYNQGCLKWESKISAQGCYYGDEIIQDLPTVYDCLSFVGFLKPQEIQLPKNYSMFLNYNVTFFLSPALEITMPYYHSKGFSTPSLFSDIRKTYKSLDLQKIYDTLNYDSSFDHQKVWETVLLDKTLSVSVGKNFGNQRTY